MIEEIADLLENRNGEETTDVFVVSNPRAS